MADWIVSLRTTGSHVTPAEGSIIGHCTDCTEPVWRSPVSRRITGTIICVQCASHRGLLRPGVSKLVIEPGQAEEIEAALKKSVP